MPRPKKLNAHLARARLLSAAVRWNTGRAATEVGSSTVNEQLNADLCNDSNEEILSISDSEEMLSDIDNSELESSSSDEDCEEQGDDYTADCGETEAVSIANDVEIALPLSWKEGAGKSLKRAYGSGSERTVKRQRRNQRELGKAAESCLDLASLFRRQKELGLSLEERRPAIMSRRQVVQQRTKEQRRLALEDLEKVLRSKTRQVEVYGHRLSPDSDFYRRHLMVRNFINMQKPHENLSEKIRREFAETVAGTFDRGRHTAEKIVKWERQWMVDGRIPESKAGKHKAHLSWLEDEGVLCAIQDFTKSQGEGKITQCVEG